jgi:hypothetical protein
MRATRPVHRICPDVITKITFFQTSYEFEMSLNFCTFLFYILVSFRKYNVLHFQQNVSIPVLQSP